MKDNKPKSNFLPNYPITMRQYLKHFPNILIAIPLSLSYNGNYESINPIVNFTYAEFPVIFMQTICKIDLSVSISIIFSFITFSSAPQGSILGPLSSTSSTTCEKTYLYRLLVHLLCERDLFINVFNYNVL